jgi:EAL domain-containing protein (putative c-di-GMP-specific phosphodiesterase class I)
LKSTGSNTKLFFNMMPNMLSTIHQEELLDPNRFHMIQLVEKYGINKENIIIEITEDEFQGKIERLLKMVEIFRNYGFKIAIDDVGVGFSNLERIGYIHPDIIKVDIKIMRESLGSNSFMQVLTALSEMSVKLGSELLFEGIETEQELTLAFKMGASLLQGYYFSKATEKFQSKQTFSLELKNSLEKFSGIRFMEIVEDFQKLQNLIDTLSTIFEEFEQKVSTETHLHPQDILAQRLKDFPEHVILVFLTDMNGYQTSPSYSRVSEKEWLISDVGIENNYAWKPYFIKHKSETFYFKKKWGVTKPLYDIQTQTQYVIFTFTIASDTILIARVNWNDS